MSEPKHWLLLGEYPQGVTVHQLRFRPSDNNKTVDIECIAQDAFLE